MNDIRRISRSRPEAFAGGPYGASRFSSKAGQVFTDAEEMELAVELLEIASEAELEQFLGSLVKKAWRGVKSVGSKLLPKLGGILKAVAKKALPFVATAAGTFFGGPAGGAIAGKLGSLVSQALELETAGLAAADRDLEKCRQFVRMAGEAARAAASAPPGSDPIAAARKTLADSAEEKLGGKAAAFRTSAAPMRTAGATGRAAPSGRSCSQCAQPLGACRCGGISRSGRWSRRGNSIIVNC